MRADNSSAIVVFIEKKKMEPKNVGTATYTEKWTSANKSGEVKKEEEKERKPLQDVTSHTVPQAGSSGTAAKAVIGRKRPSSENNNENVTTPVGQNPPKKSKITFTSSKIARRRSTRIAVKRCEHGLTRSAARKRASL